VDIVGITRQLSTGLWSVGVQLMAVPTLDTAIHVAERFDRARPVPHDPASFAYPHARRH
jgi:hypothetical protein